MLDIVFQVQLANTINTEEVVFFWWKEPEKLEYFCQQLVRSFIKMAYFDLIKLSKSNGRTLPNCHFAVEKSNQIVFISLAVDVYFLALNVKLFIFAFHSFVSKAFIISISHLKMSWCLPIEFEPSCFSLLPTVKLAFTLFFSSRFLPLPPLSCFSRCLTLALSHSFSTLARASWDSRSTILEIGASEEHIEEEDDDERGTFFTRIGGGKMKFLRRDLIFCWSICWYWGVWIRADLRDWHSVRSGKIESELVLVLSSLKTIDGLWKWLTFDCFVFFF